MMHFLAALLLFAAPAQALAQDAADEEDIGVTVSASARPETCNTRVAAKATLADALTRQDALDGECVAIRGVARHHRLFATANEAESAPPAWSDHDSRARPWVGLYGRSQSWEGPMLLVGVLAHCETAFPGGAMGYCHETHGPILIIAEKIVD